MIGGFLGGLANAGQVVRGADEAQNETLKRALIQLELRQAQQQDAALGLAGQALPYIGQGGDMAQGGLPQGMPSYQPGQVQQAPLGPPPSQQPIIAPNLAGPGVNWQGEDPVLKQRVSAMLSDAPPDISQASAVTSGLRTNQQQADAYHRYQTGQGGLAAPPGKSLHETGQAADWTFKNPQADQWVHQNAGRFGLEFPLGARDPNHMQLVKGEVQRTGLEAIKSGVPAAPVREASQAAITASSSIDPSTFGRSRIHDLAQAIEKAAPGAPPAVKMLALMQLNKLMAPEDQQMFRYLLAQQRGELQMALTQRRGEQQLAAIDRREQSALDVEGYRQKGRVDIETQKEVGRGKLEAQKEEGRVARQNQRLVAAEKQHDQINERLDRHFEQNQARLKGNEAAVEQYRKAMLNLNSLKAEQDPLNPDPKIAAEIEKGRQNVLRLWQQNPGALPPPSAVMGEGGPVPQAAPQVPQQTPQQPSPPIR